MNMPETIWGNVLMNHQSMWKNEENKMKPKNPSES